MAVTIDVYGSCVSRDLFRYVSAGKYDFRRCVTQIPVTSLYEKVLDIKLEHIRKSAMGKYDRTMFRIQTGRILPALLKENKSDFIVIDLADELMERWEVMADGGENGVIQLAQIPGLETEYEEIFRKEDGYTLLQKSVPFGMEMSVIEKKLRTFAKEILYSKNNPDGYLQEQIVIIEALCAGDVMGNDAVLRPQDPKYKVKESNEWLRKLYASLYRYFPNSHVIRFPDFTHSTPNHMDGVHPLYYMSDIYGYFERALDVATHYSNVNTLENLWREQSLKNKLEARVVNSSMMYDLQRQVKKLQEQIKQKNNG